MPSSILLRGVIPAILIATTPQTWAEGETGTAPVPADAVSEARSVEEALNGLRGLVASFTQTVESAGLPRPQIEKGTVWLDPGPGGEDRALLESVAECLSAGPLHLAARIGAPRGEKEEGIGIRIDLSDRAERPRKLAWIAGALEARALARPPAAKPH